MNKKTEQYYIKKCEVCTKETRKTKSYTGFVTADLFRSELQVCPVCYKHFDSYNYINYCLMSEAHKKQIENVTAETFEVALINILAQAHLLLTANNITIKN